MVLFSLVRLLANTRLLLTYTSNWDSSVNRTLFLRLCPPESWFRDCDSSSETLQEDRIDWSLANYFSVLLYLFIYLRKVCISNEVVFLYLCWSASLCSVSSITSSLTPQTVRCVPGVCDSKVSVLSEPPALLWTILCTTVVFIIRSHICGWTPQIIPDIFLVPSPPLLLLQVL